MIDQPFTSGLLDARPAGGTRSAAGRNMFLIHTQARTLFNLNVSEPRPTSVDDLSLDELRGLVEELLARVSVLEEENGALKDKVARLKGLKGRPKLKPSGMEKATSRTKAFQACRRRQRRALVLHAPTPPLRLGHR